VQTTGGRTGLPAPRRVKHPPFVQFRAPTVWTTLALTIFADGTSSFEVLGASKFPRHWVFDNDGNIAAKVGLANFKDWYRDAFGKHTPWGDRDSQALVTAVESALERQLSVTIMSDGARPEIRTIKKGKCLVQQGDPGDALFLLLDGVLSVQIDGEAVAEVGPGVVLGERAVLEGGIRTATLEAKTEVRVAVASADKVDREALKELREHHRVEK
jgi:Cyclic nucleotide-binding domain